MLFLKYISDLWNDTAVQKEIDQIEAELVEVRGRMAGHLKELGVDV